MSERQPASTREWGRIEGADGPTVVVVAAMHGNEPAGLRALEQVFAEIEHSGARPRGRLIGLVGNRPALAKDVRYLERDLNRRWNAADLAALHSRRHRSEEDEEQLELLAWFESCPGRLHVLDLHSFSARGPAFSVVSAAPQSHALARTLAVPIIFGLAEAVGGTLLDYLASLGHVAVGFEGGTHADPETTKLHAAAIWTTLLHAGLFERPAGSGDVAERLDRARGPLPRAVELIHRHAIDEGDEFQMDPGWSNFDPVARGQVVARDLRGPLGAPADGLMLMPLYQALGQDGFFIARPLA